MHSRLHPSTAWRHLGIASLAAVLTGLRALHGQPEPAPAPPAPKPLPSLVRFDPLPRLVERARELGVPTEELAEAAPAAGLPPDSTVVALVVHREEDRHRQWLVQLVASAPDEAEANAPEGAALRVHTSTGNEIVFAGRPAGISIRVIGPVEETSGRKRARAPKEVWSGAKVDAEFLALGLDRASAAIQRMSTAARERDTHGSFGWSFGPFPPEKIESSRAAAEAIGLTLEDERAFVGSTLALIQFLNIAANTPAVRDIVRELLELNLWTLIRHGGMPRIDIELISAAGPLDVTPLGLGQFEAQSFPFLVRLEGEPKLVCVLAVTAPRAPYTTSAGILALAAERVDRPESRLSLRLIASRLPEAR